MWHEISEDQKEKLQLSIETGKNFNAPDDISVDEIKKKYKYALFNDFQKSIGIDPIKQPNIVAFSTDSVSVDGVLKEKGRNTGFIADIGGVGECIFFEKEFII